MSEIEFDKVRRVYNASSRETVALDDVSLTIADKEFVALVGPSGAVRRRVCAWPRVSIFRPGFGPRRRSRRARPGPDRAVVFQHFALFPWMTVSANIMLGLRNANVPKAAAERRVAEVLALMNLQGTERAFPHQLSGGMQQRVAIARAYVLDPEVLLMDEPFGALDAQTRVVMQEELVRLARINPRTVLFITHAVEEAVYLADRVVVITRGPGKIKTIIPVKPIRESEGWNRKERIEEVMNEPSFVQLRTEIWRLLREEQKVQPKTVQSKQL